LFNPHQFAWNDFFIDYRDYMRWLSRGNSRSHASSWISFCRLARTRITGYKRKAVGEPTSIAVDVPRAHFTNLFVSEIVSPLFLVLVTGIPYLFINAQTGVLVEPGSSTPITHSASSTGISPPATSALIRVTVIAIAPIAINAGVAGMMFALACCMGPLLSMCCKKFGSVLAAIAHCIAVVMMIVIFEVMYVLETFNFARMLLGMITVIAIQRFVIKLIVALALTREFKSDSSNIAWWTGKWYNMGWHSLSQPGREFLCKITELTMFAGDFILGHFILFVMLPFLVIPYIDKFHSMMLFWLRPSKQIRPPIYSLKQSKLRKRRVVRYAILYFIMLIVFLLIIIGPLVASSHAGGLINELNTLSKGLKGMVLIQPNNDFNNDTLPSVTGTNINPELSAKHTANSSD